MEILVVSYLTLPLKITSFDFSSVTLPAQA